ncbi:MAG: hypothetical protein ACF8NJ_09455, partial [Phycisphaerales bacterium JB038]
RRGIAMLLVLVCLATMAVMTAAYLSAHGNAGAIAENATEVVETEVAARSAGDLAEAVLQADKNLTPAQIKQMFQDHNLGDLTITAKATTFEGADPSGAAEPLLITVEAHGSQHRHRLQKTASFKPSQDIAVNLDEMDWTAGEFAIFGRDSVTIQNGSIVTRWASSPLAARSKALKIGTNSENSGSVDLKSNAGITGGHAYIRPTASATALDIDTTFATVTRQDLPSGLPIILAPIDFLSWAMFAATIPGEELSGVNTPFSGDKKLDWCKVTNGAVMTMSDGSRLAVADDLLIDSATLRIDGHVQIFVFDNMTLDHGAAIELTDGSTLELFVADNIDVKESAIGFSKEILAAGPLPSAALPYADPKNILIAGGSVDPNHVYIDNGSIVRGRIYAQLDDVQIKGASALYGCVLGRDVKLDQGSYLHYDHTLDCEIGYTATDGPLYDEADGELIDELFTDVPLSLFAAAKDAVLEANGATNEAVVEVAEVAPEITVRKKARCIARPRPTKARKYEGQPLAHAEEEAL